MDDSDMEESVGSEQSHLDRLSELPDSLIHHILSFLPMRDVVSTTLLSKRWEDLWTTLPYLNFSVITRDYLVGEDVSDIHGFRNFVNRALLIWRGNKLLKFKMLIGHHFDKSLASDVNSWVRFAVENKVEELDISLFYARGEDFHWEDVYLAPQRLNSCSSIKKLSLVGCDLHGFPAWNQLKSLSIDECFFSEDMINRILLGAPQLEEFVMRLIDRNENLNIRSTSLKKLKISKYLCSCSEQASQDTVLTICCPNLETLQFSGVLYSKCLLTDVSALTDATINLRDTKCYDACGLELLGETMRHMFSTFQHVERLTLSSSSIQVIEQSQKKNLLEPLPNVVCLKLDVCFHELVEMVQLLEIFPNLKMLVIKDDFLVCTILKGHSPVCSPDINVETILESETDVSKSFLLQLKVVEITSSFVGSSMFRYLKFLLRRGSMLEKLVIWADRYASWDQERLFEVTEALLSMPRSSPTAEVIFKKKIE